MHSCPLLSASSDVQIEELHILLLQSLIKLDYSLNTFLLAFPSSQMQRSPIIIILTVDSSSVHDEEFSYRLAFLRVLREHIHHEMQRCVAFTISFIDISSAHDELLNNPHFKFDHS